MPPFHSPRAADVLLGHLTQLGERSLAGRRARTAAGDVSVYFVGAASLTKNSRSPGSNVRGTTTTRRRFTLAARVVVTLCSFLTSGLSRGGCVEVSSTGKRSLNVAASLLESCAKAVPTEAASISARAMLTETQS